MKILKETTEWAVDYPLKNHTYFVTDNRERMIGYLRAGTSEPIKFKTVLPFNTKGRKFVEVPDVYNFAGEVETETRGVTYTVRGSGVNIYTVSNDHGSWSCTCPASKWQRGDCKHVRSIQDQAQ